MDGWDIPPERPVASRDEVHVWRASLDPPEARARALERLLCPDEIARADRFRFASDRGRFVAARGALRLVLAGYLGASPERLRFAAGAFGKPYLAGESVRFNLSHSGGLALCAVTEGREVGVDVERVRPDLAGEEIAERYFSRREAAALRALPEAARAEAFFACWTRKEAYVKALGGGLSIDLDSFDVSLAPGEPAALLGVRSDPDEVLRWSLREIAPAEGYAGALAVEGSGWRLRRWDADSLAAMKPA